jgi:hypothetical protein
MGTIGTRAERGRVPLADGTLVATPDVPDDTLIPSLLAASDVLGTGWFGASAAEAGPGKTVAVVGDGAVGLLAILAAIEPTLEELADRALANRSTCPIADLGHEPGEAAWASLLVPLTMRCAYRLRPVRGSRPVWTRSSQDPGARCRTEPVTAPS